MVFKLYDRTGNFLGRLERGFTGEDAPPLIFLRQPAQTAAGDIVRIFGSPRYQAGAGQHSYRYTETAPLAVTRDDLR